VYWSTAAPSGNLPNLDLVILEDIWLKLVKARPHPEERVNSITVPGQRQGET
jgi:hypothetical protein